MSSVTRSTCARRSFDTFVSSPLTRLRFAGPRPCHIRSRWHALHLQRVHKLSQVRYSGLWSGWTQQQRAHAHDHERAGIGGDFLRCVALPSHLFRPFGHKADACSLIRPRLDCLHHSIRLRRGGFGLRSIVHKRRSLLNALFLHFVLFSHLSIWNNGSFFHSYLGSRQEDGVSDAWRVGADGGFFVGRRLRLRDDLEVAVRCTSWKWTLSYTMLRVRLSCSDCVSARRIVLSSL